MTTIDLEVNTRGPLFDARAGAEVGAFLLGVQSDVAKAGLAEVHLILDRTLRNPTPYYETQVIAERVGTDMVVHDRGIVYGPWLEGVGSRNRTTRFKGYWNWRRATAELRRKVPAITAAAQRRLLDRLG